MPLDARAVQRLRREVPRSIFRDAALFGLEAAVPTTLYGKKAFWIPRAVSDAPGGRQTIYDLPEGQETLLGIYVLDGQIVKELVTRMGPNRYSTSLQTVGGKVLFSGEGDLEVLDDQVGYGRIRFRGIRTETARLLLDIEAGESNKTNVWVLWSCIKVDHE